MLHFAEDDSLIGPEARAAVHDALDDNRHITILDYPGVDHGFATTSGKRRNDTAARLADQRTEAFFAEHLL
jgi:carboxymethylenebutenolidase